LEFQVHRSRWHLKQLLSNLILSESSNDDLGGNELRIVVVESAWDYRCLRSVARTALRRVADKVAWAQIVPRAGLDELHRSVEQDK